jgi:predicted nucleic acid-binding protein
VGNDVVDVVIDASVWVSRISIADVGHARTNDWFDRAISAGGRFVAPILVLAEVAGAVARTTNDTHAGRVAADALSRLPALHLVSLDDVIGMRAAELAAELRLRGPDAVYVAVAERLGLPLVSWDSEQRARASTVVVTLAPT